MPDWSYRTVLGAVLFRIPPASAQRLALASLALLGRGATGRWLIDLLGHMRPDARLACAPGGLALSGPVGLAALVDPGGCASAALSRFGAGFVEVGPVTDQAGQAAQGLSRDLRSRELGATASARVALAALPRTLSSGPRATPIWLRIAEDAHDPAAIASALYNDSAAFVLEASGSQPPQALEARVAALAAVAGTRSPARPVLLSVRADDPHAVALSVLALEAGARGVWVRGEYLERGELRWGAAARALVEARIVALRAACPGALIVAGGVLEPADVQRFTGVGAQLLAVDAGLVLSGPGLIKRCNEALVLAMEQPEPEPFSLEAARSAWCWALLLGLAMLLGGVLALSIASTRVVLPYDEALCGMTRGQLQRLNPRLLPFMAHDRVSLAGSMLSLGTLYTALGWCALRRGAHWAHVTVVASALSGFFSFFLFLGFGYFDPFHAFVSAVLFQIMLLCLIGARHEARALALPDLHETPAWRRGQWGQLLFVVLGLGLLGAGAVICVLGSTSVFVREDLEYMRTTAATLAVAHERLVALVAHDRASLGGMLLANGVALLCSALWGFRAGARWLWWALCWAGNLAFGAAVGVHFVVGYTSPFHLAPALAGWALWLLALGLSYGWLCARRRDGSG